MAGRRLGVQAHPGPTFVRGTVPVGVQIGIAAGAPSNVVTYHSSNYTAYAQLAVATGAQIVRFDYSTGAGTPFANLHDACRAAGMDVLPILIIKATKSIATTQSEATDLITRYPRIRKVELGNEVNGTSQYGGTPDAADYVPKAQAASNILRGNGIKLCSSGLSQGPGNAAGQAYLQAMIDNGIDPYVDAYGVHGYGSAGRSFVSALRSTLVTNGLSARKMWVSECGASTTDGPYTGVTYAAQATEISTVFSTFATSGYVDDFHVYSNVDHDTTGGTTIEEHYGMWKTDAINTQTGNAKDSVAAFQAGMATYAR